MKGQSVNTNYRSMTLKAIDKHFTSFVLGIFTCSILIFTSAFVWSKHIPLAAVTQKTTSKTIEFSPKKYVVKEGDDLWKIAQSNYGSGLNADDIARYNNLTDPNGIYAGQVIVLPLLTPKAATQGEITETAASTSRVTFKGNTYTLKEGQSLSDVAQEVYGDSDMWPRIANANHIINADLVSAGTVLTIPR